MTRNEHIERTNGEGNEIHRQLDRFFHKFMYDHRVVMHHRKGIELIVKEFGEEIRWIAEQHVLDDWEGKIPEDHNDRNFYRREWAVDIEKFDKAFQMAKWIHDK
jgi:hypothetical protein